MSFLIQTLYRLRFVIVFVLICQSTVIYCNKRLLFISNSFYQSLHLMNFKTNKILVFAIEDNQTKNSPYFAKLCVLKLAELSRLSDLLMKPNLIQTVLVTRSS